jgi:hypothetical protein
MLMSRATKSALGWVAGVAIVALLAGSVRVLPWVLDPSVPARVALPFAKTLAEAALEAALALGWPIGWALAAQAMVERGEARVFALLGERPRRTVARLLPHGAAFAGALALVGFMGGRDANAPGRVAQELVEQARNSCTGTSVEVVPFVNAVWLCRPDAPARLYASGPGGLPVTGASIRLSGDLRRIEIDDARLRFITKSGDVGVHASTLALRGLAPWGQSSTLTPIARGLLLALSALGAACMAVAIALQRMARSRLGAFAVGASGPLAMLGAMRALDRSGAREAVYLLLPVAAIAATAAIGLLASRLLGRKRSVRV